MATAKPASWLFLALASYTLIIGVLPVFLTGVLSVQLMSQLGFGPLGLGLAVGAFRAAGAVSTGRLGRRVDRIGALRSLRMAALIAACACLGVAVGSFNLATLVFWLVLAGIGIAIGQPAANRLVVGRIPIERRGTAFGLKQASPPIASFLAGLGAPLIALEYGWRWAFIIGSALALVALVFTKIASTRVPRQTGRSLSGGHGLDLRTRSTLTVAIGLGTVASSSLVAFYVDSAVRTGVDQTTAGFGLGLASVVAVAVRAASGPLSDRIKRGHLELCGWLLLAGAIGTTGLTIQPSGLLGYSSVIVALVGTWGFNGLFWFAVVGNDAEPGSVTGQVLPGALIGASLGPIAFGAIANTSYDLAWLVIAAAAAMAGVLMFMGARRARHRHLVADLRGAQ
jgi:MFS family permease